MGYNPTPGDQWSVDDLAQAAAAGDADAINRARRAGHLHDILNPAQPEAPDADRLAAVLATPVGPTVPTQQPGAAGASGYGSGALMDQAELDRLAASGDYAAINEARRAGRLSNLLN